MPTEKFLKLPAEEQARQAKEITSEIVDEYSGGRKKLAEDLGVSYNTLCRWCNEFLESHLIPPHLIIGLYHLTKDDRLIKFICRHTRHLAVPLPPMINGFPEIARTVGVSSIEFGEFLSRVGLSLEKGSDGGSRITPAELEQILKEGHEAMSAIAAVLESVKSYAFAK